ncbi:hypothetical protein SNEBB_010689 [Seison nebaliae]|nr:hypothetical protein SNEBB_010689 [Seison nebaliae]
MFIKVLCSKNTEILVNTSIRMTQFIAYLAKVAPFVKTEEIQLAETSTRAVVLLNCVPKDIYASEIFCPRLLYVPCRAKRTYPASDDEPEFIEFSPNMELTESEYLAVKPMYASYFDVVHTKTKTLSDQQPYPFKFIPYYPEVLDRFEPDFFSSLKIGSCFNISVYNKDGKKTIESISIPPSQMTLKELESPTGKIPNMKGNKRMKINRRLRRR